MSTQNTSTSIGFSSLLTIVFIVLKLIKVIDWSWWWILSPLWISAIVWISLVVLFIYFGNKR